MIKVNNAKLDWHAYEYGCKADGHRNGIVEWCGTKEQAERLAEKRHGKVKFRAVYVTEWMDTL